MVMTNWWIMIVAMLLATALYDLGKTLYKHYNYYRQVRKINIEVDKQGKPVGYIEIKNDGTLLEHVFDSNYRRKDISN